MRDRKSTGRGIAEDTELTYRERLGIFKVWAAGRGLGRIDEVDADAVDSFFIYLRDERKNPRTGEPLGDNTIPRPLQAARDFPEPETEQHASTDQDMGKVLSIFDSDSLYTETDFPDRDRSARARWRLWGSDDLCVPTPSTSQCTQCAFPTFSLGIGHRRGYRAGALFPRDC